MVKRNTVLTIAGHDPSNGAGLGADLKVFEAWGVQGFSVVTAVTVQNESEFIQPGWVEWNQIEAQLEGLYRKHQPRYFKIGLVENATTLGNIVQWIRSKDPSAFILWDPILKATAGFQFHNGADHREFVDVCSHLSLVTPNKQEADWLGPLACPTLMKGGHETGEICVDILRDPQGEIARFEMPRLENAAKHGTGCVLSSTILTLLSLGYRLERACNIGRSYLQEYLQSSEGLLGNVGESLPSTWRAEANKVNPLYHRLYAISWDGAPLSHVQQVAALCRGGVGIIQLRMKAGTLEERLATAWECLRLCRQWGALLVINDDVELAKTIQAPAVHLGLKDMTISEARRCLGSDVILGGTANTPEQVLARMTEGANYVGLGPWRYTETKQNLSSVLGEEGVAQTMREVLARDPYYPVYVIGGIGPKDCKEIIDLGARGVAVSSALVSAPSISNAIHEFTDALTGQGNRI